MNLQFSTQDDKVSLEMSSNIQKNIQLNIDAQSNIELNINEQSSTSEDETNNDQNNRSLDSWKSGNIFINSQTYLKVLKFLISTVIHVILFILVILFISSKNLNISTLWTDFLQITLKAYVQVFILSLIVVSILFFLLHRAALARPRSQDVSSGALLWAFLTTFIDFLNKLTTDMIAPSNNPRIYFLSLYLGIICLVMLVIIERWSNNKSIQSLTENKKSS